MNKFVELAEILCTVTILAGFGAALWASWTIPAYLSLKILFTCLILTPVLFSVGKI